MTRKEELPAKRTNQSTMAQPVNWMTLLLLLSGAGLWAQEAPTPQTVPDQPNLLRVEGVDAETHVHYVRLLLSQPGIADSTSAPPRLTFECLENAGKLDFKWYVSFGGITDYRFLPPFHPTPGVPYHLGETDVDLNLSYEGALQHKPYKGSWTLLSTGELRYRNPGFHSPNLEPLSFFLGILKYYPAIRIAYAAPGKNDPAGVVFHPEPLLKELKESPACAQ